MSLLKVTPRSSEDVLHGDGSVGSNPVSVSLSLPHRAVIYFKFIILNSSFKHRDSQHRGVGDLNCTKRTRRVLDALEVNPCP